MRRNRQPFFLWMILWSGVLAGCYQSRKAQLSEQLQPVKTEIRAKDSSLNVLKEKMQFKLQNADVDTGISNRVGSTIQQFQYRNDSLQKRVIVMDSLMSKRKSLRKTYKKILTVEAQSLAAVITDSIMSHRQQVVFKMVDDVLDKAKQNMFNLAAFFAPGEFTIPDSSMALVDTMFGPLLDSLIVFSNKYAQLPREATLSFYGYADGQPIHPESALAQTLTSLGNLQQPTAADLNRELSRLRAEAMSKALHQLYEQRKSRFLNPELLDAVDIIIGMGEQYPNSRITDYQVDDERRRIVLFYWSVLPK